MCVVVSVVYLLIFLLEKRLYNGKAVVGGTAGPAMAGPLFWPKMVLAGPLFWPIMFFYFCGVIFSAYLDFLNLE